MGFQSPTHDTQDKEKGRRRGSLTDSCVKIGLYFAGLLQSLVRVLEWLIELLGQSPERRWEDALQLPGFRPPPPDALAKRARQLADRGEPEAALRLYAKVLEIEPGDITSLDASAELLAELGDVDGAKELIIRSVEVKPEGNPAKYVLLGHLETGARAISAYERALSLYHRELDALQGAETERGAAAREAAGRRRDLRKSVGGATAAIAKVYLTDCVGEEGSIVRCERLLDRALELDPDSPEACQALADLRLTQGRRGEALLLVRRTVDLCRRLDGGANEWLPSYDFRMVTSRLLVELSQYDTATLVLEELVAEDDLDTEAWYLLGLCRAMDLSNLDARNRARDALGKARALLVDADAAGGMAAGACHGEGELLSKIDALLAREAIAEEEKEGFWNPRWWVATDGGARAPTAATLPRIDSGSPLSTSISLGGIHGDTSTQQRLDGANNGTLV